MGLQLMLGGSGTGKSYYLYESVMKKSIECPDEKFMVIVPEQFTMASQRRIVQMSPRRGSLNVDIVSFERLAKRLFEEAGIHMLQVLDDTGKCLVLRKVMEEHKEQLTVFGKKVRMAGFVEEMKSVVSEFCQYGVNEEAFSKIQEKVKEKPLLAAKFQDISLILSEFKAYLENRFVINEELLVRVCELLPHSELIRNSHIVLDEYTGFTPVQYQVLQGLMKYAKSVTVTLTMRGAIGKIQGEQKSGFWEEQEQDIFQMTVKTANRLKRLAEEAEVKLHPDKIFSQQKRLKEQGDLWHLEQSLFEAGAVKRKWRGNISVTVCMNPVMEAESIAQNIQYLIREQGLRYKDIAVLTPDIEGYHRPLGDAFKKYQIPCFIDYKRSIRSNPMVEAIRGALELVKERFSYESVFRFLKTYMSSLTMEEIDILENHVLAKGIRGYRLWSGDFRTEEPELLALRDKFMEDVGEFYEHLKDGNGKKGISVKTAITELYQFGVRMELEKKTLQLKKQFEERGELSLAKEYQQSYGKVMELYDKTILLLGEEVLSLEELISILDAGFEEIKVGVIPPTLDSVAVGDIERTRLMDIQVLFLAGANDGLIPKAVSKKGILNQAEREFIDELGIELSPTERENSFIQKFYLYRVLTKPSKGLYISYKRTSSSGESCRSSYLVGQIGKLYQDLPVIDWEKKLKQEPLRGITNEITAYSYLAEHVGNYLEQRKDPLFRQLYQELKWREQEPEILLKAANVGRETGWQGKLRAVVASMLYGDCLSNSVSRLERFAQCPYQHFIDYGLQLVERKRYEVMPADIGTMYHEALDSFSKCMQEQEWSWKTISDEQRDALVQQVLQKLEQKYENQPIQDTARNRYLFQSIRQVTAKTIKVLQKQLKQSEFEPQGFEVRFSTERGLKELSCQYEDGKMMELKGTLDRVDYYYAGDDIYIKIVDYKSGVKKFNISDVYHHLQLQLVVYMEAAVAMAKQRYPEKQIRPAGIFYYNIDDPVLEQEEIHDDWQEAYLEALKPNGLMTNETVVLEALDTKLVQNHNEAYQSAVIPVKRNKNGSLSAYSSCVTAEEFQALLEYTRQEIHQLGEEILAGTIAAKPCAKQKQSGVENENSAPCTYCQYQGICGFDKHFQNHQYRILEPKGIQDICKVVAERRNKDAVVTTTEEGN